MSEKYYKRLHTPRQLYRIMVDALRTIPSMRRSKANKTLTDPFMERIMLAVTEVNGCELCSYYHTGEALKSGMSEKDIQMMLDGDSANIPEHESVAIFFAQHYAETIGHPTEEAWSRVVDTYGGQLSLGLLGAIRAIMFGNASGIPMSALRSRFKGKPTGKTTLFYELGMTLVVLPYLPVAILHSLIETLLRRPLITYSQGPDPIPNHH